MNKGTKKGASYFIFALFFLSTALPIVSDQYKAVKWLTTASAVTVALWRGKDYLTKGDSEDEGDKAVADTLPKDTAG